MRSWIGTGEGRLRKSVLCWGECERVFVVYCGNVQHTVVLKLNFCRICWNALEIVTHPFNLGIVQVRLSFGKSILSIYWP